MLLKKITLNLVDTYKIVVSEKLKTNDKDLKYFIGCLDDNIIRPLCIILPKTGRYIKHFDDGGKNMPFLAEDGIILVKYNEI